MNAEKAFRHIGATNSTEPYLSHMIRALELMPWLNSAEDEERLAAARWVKRHRREYRAYLQSRRH